MDLRSYIAMLRKRWFLIIVCVVLGLGAAVAFLQTSTKTYTASAQIFVAASSSADSTTTLNNGNSFAEARVQSYTSVANSPNITQPVVNELHLAMTSQQLSAKITADAPLNEVLLNLHVNDTSAVAAARIANAVAAQLTIYVENIEKLSAGTAQSPVKLTVIHPALVPKSPTSPVVKLDLAIGFIAGLLVGLIIATLRETLDTRVRTISDIEENTTGAILAVVPSDRRTASSPIAILGDGRGPRAEAYRQLRTNLQYIDVDSPPKLIALTSAVSGEGKSTSSVNLAYAMAEAGLKVCLVDADLRRPRLATYLGLIAGAGLTSILAGKASISDVIQPVSANLSVITSGPIPPNPSQLLASEQFRSTLKALSAQVDYVVIDSAPLLPVADGSEVASAADVTLLVVQARRTNREQLQQATASLRRVNARLGGVIFNMVASRDAGSYAEYYADETPKGDPLQKV